MLRARYFVISEATGDALLVRAATSAVGAFLVCVDGVRTVRAIPERCATRQELLQPRGVSGQLPDGRHTLSGGIRFNAGAFVPGCWMEARDTSAISPPGCPP